MKQEKMGKGMLIAAWVVGLGLLTYMFDEQLAQQLNPNQDPITSNQQGIAEVKLKQNRAGHYVSGGAINGQPVVFMLDTGATQVSIPMHLAQQLGLSTGRGAWAQTANGRVQVFQTRIQRLSIGDIELVDVAAHLNPAMLDEQILLGMSALKQLEFTQKGEWLNLRHL